LAERKPFLLRVDPALLEALQRWASDDLRSLNGQIEFLLRRALTEGGRMKGGDRPAHQHQREHQDDRPVKKR
jgi:hypothetical protein